MQEDFKCILQIKYNALHTTEKLTTSQLSLLHVPTTKNNIQKKLRTKKLTTITMFST